MCVFRCSCRSESITLEKLGFQFLDTILGSILEGLGVRFWMLLGCMLDAFWSLWGPLGKPWAPKCYTNRSFSCLFSKRLLEGVLECHLGAFGRALGGFLIDFLRIWEYISQSC